MVVFTSKSTGRGVVAVDFVCPTVAGLRMELVDAMGMSGGEGEGIWRGREWFTLMEAGLKVRRVLEVGRDVTREETPPAAKGSPIFEEGATVECDGGGGGGGEGGREEAPSPMEAKDMEVSGDGPPVAGGRPFVREGVSVRAEEIFNSS